MQITTIGLDIAKNVFQVHGVDAAEMHQEPDTPDAVEEMQSRFDAAWKTLVSAAFANYSENRAHVGAWQGIEALEACFSGYSDAQRALLACLLFNVVRKRVGLT